MTETSKRKQRTWSAFGDVRRMPSEYEIVTHGTNWTLREGRTAALEQNPSSPANLWYLTYRDGSALQAGNWEGFRDPDALTYRKYVAMQHTEEGAVAGVLDKYSGERHDETLTPAWVQTLQLLFTTTRFSIHAAQQVQAYTGFMSPSPYIMNAAAFATGDLLRRVSLIAYRTRELALAWPEHGFAARERELWQSSPEWQPARELIETSLVAYDWAEAFTAMNLVILPTLDEILLGQLGRVAHTQGDDLTWMLLGHLSTDSERRARWSAALAAFAVNERAENRAVFEKWIAKWALRTDRAVEGLAVSLSGVDEGGPAAGELVRAAAAARAGLHREAQILVGEDASEPAGALVG
jgi:toluene monooxygenase system protein E